MSHSYSDNSSRLGNETEDTLPLSLMYRVGPSVSSHRFFNGQNSQITYAKNIIK